MYDVIIIGAGPAGCKVGELLGKDHDVLIIDKKSEIGKPVQCTGLVSNRIFDLSGLSKKVVLNKVKESKFFSPNGNYATLKPKRPFYILDREAFDKELAKKAKENNAKIKLKTEFKGLRRHTDFLEIQTNKGNFKTKLLVGADGPSSTVAKVTNLLQPNNLLVGVQETVKGNFDINSVELWFGPSITPDFFAWVVPEDEKWARVGLASSRNSGDYFQNFLKRRFGKIIESKDKVAGLIRYGLIKNSASDRILLVGDAACQIKPLTGGGLVYGLIGAKIAAEACRKSLNRERYDHKFLKNEYDKKWKKELKLPIIQGLISTNGIHMLPDWIFNLGCFVGKGVGFIFQELVDEDFGLFKKDHNI